MEQSHSPSGGPDEGSWSKRFWRSVSPSKESRSTDGRDEAEVFRERATYITQEMDGDDGGKTYAKAKRRSSMPVGG